MKRYELTYLAPAGLSEKEQKDLSLKVASYVGAIAENKQENALWVSFDFNAEPEKIEEIEAKLKEESLIKKHMIVKKEKSRPESPLFRKRKDAQESAETSAKRKIDLAEIDKKIEEILNE